MLIMLAIHPVTNSQSLTEKPMAPTRPPELIPAQRRAFMLEHIRKRGAASIQELSEAIGISLSTVRRDLEHLEARGYLERSHGGALIQKQLQSTFEPEAAITAEFDRPEKELIGLAAAQTLHSGASVIFDSSSTVLAAARAAVERDIALTAVTNDLGVGQALSASSRIRRHLSRRHGPAGIPHRPWRARREFPQQSESRCRIHRDACDQRRGRDGDLARGGGDEASDDLGCAQDRSSCRRFQVRRGCFLQDLRADGGPRTDNRRSR